MKKMFAIMVMMMTIVIQASAMSYTQARQEALYLSDKMAYELGLSAQQYADVYEINLDYLMSVNTQSDLYGISWQMRNRDLRYVLTAYQYDLFMRANYFYRPMEWSGTSWRFRVYTRYTNRSHYYYAQPSVYGSYRGGNMRTGTSYYANRHYTQPTPMGGTNWRQNSGAGHPATGHHGPTRSTTTTTTTTRTTTHHGTTAPAGQGNGNWRQNASGKGKGSSTTTTTTTTRQGSSTRQGQGGGNFHGKR
jgi:hypothetical protein